MKLNEYLHSNGISITQLADDLEVHYSHVLRILNNTRQPSPKLALKIEQATEGQVSRMELLYPNHTETPS